MQFPVRMMLAIPEQCWHHCIISRLPKLTITPTNISILGVQLTSQLITFYPNEPHELETCSIIHSGAQSTRQFSSQNPKDSRQRRCHNRPDPPTSTETFERSRPTSSQGCLSSFGVNTFYPDPSAKTQPHAKFSSRGRRGDMAFSRTTTGQ